MSWLRVRVALLTSVVLAASAACVRADGPCAPSCAPSCGPQYRTVCVTEWVPEHYESCRTVFKDVCVPETHTVCHMVCTPEQQTHQVTVYKSVCETHNECRTVCTCVPTCEERTVYKHVCHSVQETCYEHHCVDKGHYECCEVPCTDYFAGFRRMFRRNDCCCDCCECERVRTRTVRKWCPCMVDECVPVCHWVNHDECVPCVEHFTCYKQVESQVNVPVTCWHCEPCVVNQCCTVWVPHTVTCQETCYTHHCEPVEVKVDCCRMVPHVVEKQVPCCDNSCCDNNCCQNSCCENSCCDTCCYQGGFRGFHLGGRLRGCRSSSSCGCGCN